MTGQDPTWVSLRIVQLAARTQPSRHRLRYEGEFIAELYGMARTDQVRHATQILAHAWFLRNALNSAPAAIGEEAVSHLPTIPLTCRLNLRHKWRMFSTEDGSNHYWVCAICDRKKSDSTSSLRGGIGYP